MAQPLSSVPTPDVPSPCDPAVFAQVWSRVAPGEDCPVEPTAPLPVPQSPGPGPATVPQEDPRGHQLQAMVRECLHDAATYRALTRRSRRSRQELADLAGWKTRQAKRLSAAYFLLSGVRYWPQAATAPEPPESFFPVLRQQFLAERRRTDAWRELGEREPDPDLQALYLTLAQEAGDLAQTLRLIVERET